MTPQHRDKELLSEPVDCACIDSLLLLQEPLNPPAVHLANAPPTFVAKEGTVFNPIQGPQDDRAHLVSELIWGTRGQWPLGPAA